jgi:hypothetical protein
VRVHPWPFCQGPLAFSVTSAVARAVAQRGMDDMTVVGDETLRWRLEPAGRVGQGTR